MNATNTNTRTISLRKSSGFLGSIPKQVALWQVGMTVSMQSCKRAQNWKENASFPSVFLRVAHLLLMLDPFFEMVKMGAKNAQKLGTGHEQFAYGNTTKLSQKIGQRPNGFDPYFNSMNREFKFDLGNLVVH